MPEAHQIDVARRVVVSRAWGELSTADLLSHYRAVAADPAFDPTFAQLVDLREVTTFTLDTGVLRSRAAHSLFQPGVRRAVVAPSDVAYGLARMFGTYAESASQTIAVFRAIGEAEHWLGIDITAAHTSSTQRESTSQAPMG